MSVLLVGACPEKIKYCKAHSHPHWEIVIPILGQGRVEAGGKTVEFSQGMAYCVPPMLEHTTRSDSGFIDVYIQTEHLALNPNEITATPFEGGFATLAELILSAHLKKDQGWKGTQDSTLELIIRLIYDLTAEMNRSPITTQLRNYIIENFSSHSITTKSISAEFGYNADYLRRIFKDEYGMSPMEYLYDLRLTRAAEWLVNMPHYSVEEIGNLCGFSDRFYFSRFFKKHMGLSPTDYRRQKTQ